MSTTTRVGPLRRGGAAPDRGLNYAAIGSTSSIEVVAFPPAGFRSAEYKHRIGSGARRFDLAGRSLMTFGAMRAAGWTVSDIRAETASEWSRDAGARFLEDGTPWITPGMTAVLTGTDPALPSGPVMVLRVFDEPGRIGYIWGSMPGSAECAERLLMVEHDDEDAVQVTLRTIWEETPSRFGRRARAADARQKRLDDRIVRALHPSHTS